MHSLYVDPSLLARGIGSALLDLAKASLYHYFDSKESLLTTCLGTGAEESITRLTTIASGTGSSPERLRGLIIEQLRIITVEYPELARLFLAHLEWPVTVRERISDWHTRHDAIIKGVIEEGVKSGELGDIDISVVNFVPFWFHPEGRFSDREAFEAVADSVLLMFGVGAPPTPA